MRGLRHLPNLISTLRIFLAVPIAWELAHRRFAATLALFAVAAVSDGLDGWLAKRFGWRSALGAVLDPAADKLMLATTFATLAWLGLAPLWLVVAVIARDAVLVLGSAAYRVHVGPFSVRPSRVSKFNTFCQISFVLAAVGCAQYGWPAAALTAIGALTFVTVVLSGIDYVLAYGELAMRASQEARATGAGSVRRP